MGRMIDDSVKQKLLDSLSKEPLMVISTAYAYAKNYVLYGEDITKAWTTAVQQASILEQVKVKAQAEAYDYFKKDYENCLKAEKAAMLTELKKEIEQQLPMIDICDYAIDSCVSRHEVASIIQTKIDKLKGENNGIHEN